MTKRKNVTEVDGKVELAERLAQIGIALSLEKDSAKLLEMILLEAQYISKADGGTLYFLTEDNTLVYEIVRNNSLNIAYGGVGFDPAPLPAVPLFTANGEPNFSKQVANAVLRKTTINIHDVSQNDTYDFVGTRNFDKKHNYCTKSVLTVPMLNHKHEAIGCLQLINAIDPKTQAAVHFTDEVAQIVQALASQAAVILDNKMLIEAQNNLLESFVRIIAQAIDAKSEHTGNHCSRVPVLTEMLAKAATEVKHGRFGNFSLNEEEMYELHIAAWLHDCGKIVTPPHIMDKSTKLETIHDRIHEIAARFEVLKRDAKIRYLEAAMNGEGKKEALYKIYQGEVKLLEEYMAFLRYINYGSEYMEDEKYDRLSKIAEYEWELDGKRQPILTDDEVHNLCIRKGTINAEERKEMNNHMVHTVNMLESMPWPRHLRHVPEYACGHHEKMDGTGYPKGVLAGTMSIPARMMAVADVFEALTAGDRPYKPAKKLSEAMDIIAKFKKANHLDPDIVDLFVSSGVYREYAQRYLDPELIDAVDEQAILDIVPDDMMMLQKKAI